MNLFTIYIITIIGAFLMSKKACNIPTCAKEDIMVMCLDMKDRGSLTTCSQIPEISSCEVYDDVSHYAEHLMCRHSTMIMYKYYEPKQHNIFENTLFGQIVFSVQNIQDLN